jgi:capsular exopolysaccharide synthesis family protein
LGKFFDAMQRAAKLQDTPSPTRGSDELKSVSPDRVEGHATPEHPITGDVFPSPDDAEASGLPPGAEIRKPVNDQEAFPREVSARPPAGQTPDGHNPSTGLPEAAGDQLAKRHPFSSSNLVDSGVFRSPVYAAYERVVQKLLKYRTTPRQSLILVASAVEGEGVSTVARNTALALGRHETEQILLVDANCRKPAQHEAFGIEREIGLSDVLMGAVPLTSAIKGDDASDISVMTAGSKVPSPAQLLTASALQGVLAGMVSLFDWVIVDGPPITAYPDAASIAAACGGAVLVIGAESTRTEVVEEAKRILDATEVDLLGAVLNRRQYHIPGFIYRRL